MERDRSGVSGLTVCLAVAASVLLSRLSLGVLLFPIPTLLISYRMERTQDAVAIQAVGLAGILAWQLIPEIRLFSPESSGLLVLGLFFTLATGLTALIFTALRNYSSSVLRKLVIASVPIAVLGSIYLVWLETPAGVKAAEGILSVFAGVFPEDILGYDTQLFAYAALVVIKVCTVPFAVAFGSIPVLFTESGVNRFNSSWQAGFASMMMPPRFFWIYMGLIASCIAGRLLGWNAVFIVALNLVLGLGLHYMLNGLSVVHALFRRRNPAFPASTLIYLMFFITFIPVLDLLVWIGLTVTGLLETWVRMR